MRSFIKYLKYFLSLSQHSVLFSYITSVFVCYNYLHMWIRPACVMSRPYWQAYRMSSLLSSVLQQLLFIPFPFPVFFVFYRKYYILRILVSFSSYSFCSKKKEREREAKMPEFTTWQRHSCKYLRSGPKFSVEWSQMRFPFSLLRRTKIVLFFVCELTKLCCAVRIHRKGYITNREI